MFEQFTREARQVVNSAVEKAERRGGPVLGTEHLLLGLASSYAAFGAIFLEDFGISLESLRSGLMDRDAAALASIGIDIDLDSVDATKEPRGRRKHDRSRRAPMLRSCKRSVKPYTWDIVT